MSLGLTWRLTSLKLRLYDSSFSPYTCELLSRFRPTTFDKASEIILIENISELKAINGARVAQGATDINPRVSAII